MIYADIKYSKELKDWFPDAEWWWFGFGKRDKAYEIISNDKRLCIETEHHSLYPALTTDMLLERLPLKYKKGWITVQRYKQGDKIEYLCGYWCTGITASLISEVEVYDKSLPTALAKMLIYLKKENLIKEI